MAGLPADHKHGRELGQLKAPGAVSGFAVRHWQALGAKSYPPGPLFDEDLPTLIREWIVPGHEPPAGMLSTSDTVLTLGSCFARDMRIHLERLGLASNNFLIPAGLGSTFGLLEFVSWCVTGEETERGFRYDRVKGKIEDWTPAAERERYLLEFERAGAFVFAIAMAEVWEDRVTGGVFWRGLPEEIFAAGRQLLRVSSVEENEANLRQIVELIRTVNPEAPIVLTLAPGPLKATFGAESCMTADCVSKSILRVALDRVVKLGLDGVYYWPSFETVRWAGAHSRRRAFTYGRNGDARNASPHLVAAFMNAFVEAFYTPASVADLQARRRRVDVQQKLEKLRKKVRKSLRRGFGVIGTARRGTRVSE